ncbi:MAG: sigma-70 family RNA polymerase sigma factor [Ferruginibacter sp.]
MENITTIIIGCKKRDHRYQKIFYERYRDESLKIVFRYIYNYEEAIEITNDGFVKFFLSIDRFNLQRETDFDKMLHGWIKKIMINTAIDLLRKKMLLPEIGGISDHVLELREESTASDQIIYKDLIKGIKNLPPAYRIVFNMFIIDGYSHLEIAESLGIPVNTSKSNLARAKALMQDYVYKIESLSECSM